ncbi:MAG TPA: tRNA (adenosine(37)-N6)-threonylcarbamoyltransferase complex ATPase subunit type 1 TsaE [Chitinophagaceae bacterium]|jgi:tRNA threonylcarbamoyladenosine biosynthesis protein TsaE|nr:tRNA (adenosine(37)-N6)-threonylcarbamoyltransferase complex ATPase subunit type 1 TsaE [Chitinophagaceae bacterium]
MKSFDCSLDDLGAFAAWFWNEVPRSSVYLFYGEMGAGKTTLIGALCRALGVQSAVSSPTFSLINEYVYTEKDAVHTVYHMDLYRLRSEEEAVRAGVEDCLYSGRTCLVEWPERAPALFDATAVAVHIEPLSDTQRRVKIMDASSSNPGEHP